PAYVAFLEMGAPTLDASFRAAETVLAEGADILELGVPFSDPAADGPVIRQAADLALRNGATLDAILARVPALRAAHPDTPLVLFSYYNVVHRRGLDAFAADAARAGIDAVLLVDVPLEERAEPLSALRRHGLTLVPLVAPTTPLDRAVAIADTLDDSFLYAISVKGVTGARNELPPGLADRLAALKARISLPVVVGFGIRTPEEGAALAAAGPCDGFVNGSPLVRRLQLPPS
ncbi:MAG: tryptophan synthase subunit alpha, partial [Kiritimatiellae bacterium]|nr:tryptophan synthase subunit alpha [Kiritimatiellia bacterium]